jgi:tetratricopeptide (TPR) repeat protein
MMRVSTTLATGLFASTVLLSIASAQPAAPKTPAVTDVKPAETKTVQPETTVAPPGETQSTAVSPPTTPVTTTKSAPTEATKTQATESKPVERAKAPDKKTQAKARKAYNDATAAFKSGKYDTALVKFQEAESIIPSANAEYWIAASLDKLDRKVEALATYATFLASEDAAKAGEDKVAEAKTRFDHLRATVPGDLVLTAVPAEALITIDGQAQTEKSPLTLKLTPGDHKVLVTMEGYEPQEFTVTIEAGKKIDRPVELTVIPPPPPPPVIEKPAAPVAPPPPPPPPPAKSLLPAYVTLGIAAVAAGAGTYFGIRALSAKSDYDDHPTSSKADDVENNALISDMAFGVAITLGVTGVVLLTTPEESSTPSATLKTAPKQSLTRNRLVVSPWATPKAGGAAAVLQF